ncbi:MAG: GntR family transcriptional regulator [Lachnospiraceae bacterium]|nr:GntR family transcriptional regulator [Lachnospiraceae bacterium]
MQLIDYRDSRPIFEQIVDNFKMQILMGVLVPDEQIPSVRTLAVELSANPNTIQKAYGVLEREGYIYTVKGKGAFVRGDEKLKEDKKMELARRLKALYREADALGLAPEEIRELALGMEDPEVPAMSA